MSLIVAAVTPSLRFILHDYGDGEAIDRMLDTAEAIIQDAVAEFPSSQIHYLILSNIRRNITRPSIVS